MERNVEIVQDINGKCITMIKEILFRGRQKIPEMIKMATNRRFQENQNEKHAINAKRGWYRYNSRFALPVCTDTGEILRYNVFQVELIVRHSANGKMYLYDIINIKKETGTPL